MDKIYKLYYDSPIGILELSGTQTHMLSILFVEKKHFCEEASPILQKCYMQIDEYFHGTRQAFSLEYIFQGTAFQKKVWSSLTNIPFGKTASYKDIAQAVDNEKAVRAVGNANSKNPLGIIIPCHRVIGSNGTLTGYAGGLWRKEWLLAHEKKSI